MEDAAPYHASETPAVKEKKSATLRAVLKSAAAPLDFSPEASDLFTQAVYAFAQRTSRPLQDLTLAEIADLAGQAARSYADLLSTRTDGSTPAAARTPTDDEQRGMTWYNGLSLPERRWVLDEASRVMGTDAAAVDAWALWKTGKITMTSGRKS